MTDFSQYSYQSILSGMLNRIPDKYDKRQGSTLTLTYQATPQQIGEITTISLLDEAGEALTTSQVYIPVVDATVIKHTIPVLEGV